MTYSIQVLQHETNAQMQTGEVSKLIFSTRFVADQLGIEFTEKVSNLVKEYFEKGKAKREVNESKLTTPSNAKSNFIKKEEENDA